MRYASVCSGVEAASLAWMPLGWEAVWFSEIEPFPCAVLKNRFPGIPNLGDMTKIEGEKYRGKIDLLVGGTPCQDLSIAGKRAGFGGKRSSLALDFVRIAYESGCKWIVWENVPGVFSSRGGGDFAAFLSLLSGSKVEIPDRGFAASGFVCNARRDRYGLAWRVLDAQFTRVSGFSFAVPQRRRRVFVVGYFGDWTRAAEVLLEPDRVQWNTPPRRVKGKGVAADAKGSIRETGDGVAPDAKGGNNEAGSGVFWNGNDYAETLKANCDCDRIPDKGRLNCVIDTRCKNPNGSTLVMATGQANAEVSEAFSPALTCDHESPIVCGYETGQGYWQDGDIAGTLTAWHDSSLCADRGMSIVYENHAQDSRIKPCGECSPKINAKAGTGGGNLPLVQQKLAVRRLLPVECERLMGFPEVDVLEIGKMTKDEFIAWELASGNITVDFSTGKVFSCRTGGGTPCPPHELEGTILSGYKVVSLREKEVKKQCRVHRILWIAAHGIIPDGYVIDHINNDKLDNRLCNLQLLRPEENSTKAAKDGLYLTGEDHPKTKLTDEQKNDIITLYETEYYSVRRLAAMYGVSKSRIHQLVKRQGWTQIPWRGKPAEDCPDSPRYKACGNSMCVNVMRWIGMRIENVERRMK